MSDEIKVKFGGDFSELSKGAKEAAEAAGVAMTSSFSSFTSKLSSSLIGALGVGALATGLFNNVMEKFAQFKEISDMSRKLGISSEEYQRYSKMAKEAGVSTETFAKGIGIANRYIGGAQEGNVKNIEALEKLGFTQNQINSGSVKATDILLALAKSYEQTNSETIAAAQAQAIFGRSGLEMVGVIKQGTEALKEQMAVAARYSDEEVKRGAEIEKRIEKGKRFFDYHFGGKQAASIGYLSERSDVTQMLESQGVQSGRFGLGNEGELAEDKNRMKEITESLIENAKRTGMSLKSLSDILHDKAESIFRTSGETDFYEQLSSAIYNISMREEQSKKPKPLEVENPGFAGAIAASSLQAIGGGDINSVYAGLDYQKGSLEQLTMANQYLQMIAISNGLFAASIKSTPVNAAK